MRRSSIMRSRWAGCFAVMVSRTRLSPRGCCTMCSKRPRPPPPSSRAGSEPKSRGSSSRFQTIRRSSIGRRVSASCATASRARTLAHARGSPRTRSPRSESWRCCQRRSSTNRSTARSSLITGPAGRCSTVSPRSSPCSTNSTSSWIGSSHPPSQPEGARPERGRNPRTHKAARIDPSPDRGDSCGRHRPRCGCFRGLGDASGMRRLGVTTGGRRGECPDAMRRGRWK